MAIWVYGVPTDTVGLQVNPQLCAANVMKLIPQEIYYVPEDAQ